MKVNYTHNEGNDTLLIFLSGWGATADVVRHLTMPDSWDYLTLHDFTNIGKEQDNPFEGIDFGKYTKVYLAAWSMGVWAAEILSDLLPTPDVAVAITGTPRPLGDEYGIPESIFKGTLDGLNDENRARFNRRMCGGKKLLAMYESFSARSKEDLQGELLYVYHHADDKEPLPHFWTRAIVGDRDLIFPPKNQIRHWSEAGVPTDVLEGIGHYPFLEYETWTQLLHL